MNAAVARLSRDLGRSPSAQEVAGSIETSPEQVLEAMEAGMAYDAVSLESTRGPDGDEGDSYAETIGEEDSSYELVEYGATIAPEVAALPSRDRRVLHLRFVEDLTQSEIAQRIGVSQMHVSRLIRRAITRLRDATEESPPA